MSLGCCDGGGPFGKRLEFKAGEKVGDAREPFQAGRLRRFVLRDLMRGHGVRGNRSKTYRGPESSIPFFCLV